jgi:ABC-type uncharacterized transport system ATPase subunit
MTAPDDKQAIGVETVGMAKAFGTFTALDSVSMRVAPGSFHALLGENGAGKSTLVKCIMGFYQPSAGQLMVNNREVEVGHPRDAHKLGLGMVYQHFTLVPSLTGAENLVINRDDAPAIINWKREAEALDLFLQTMPFDVDLHVPVSRLSAGEKQKLELLKQLYLGRRFLILDEPTSVLTPMEADELLDTVRAMTRENGLTVLMITHKFREVESSADEFTVLRRGRKAGGGHVRDLTREDMTQMMIGERKMVATQEREGERGSREVFRLSGATAPDRSGLKQIAIESLVVHAREIVGVAGVSGNGQFELVEIISGQRPLTGGTMSIDGKPFNGSRLQQHEYGVRIVPEEPLRNASAPGMSVAENMAFRGFDFGASGRPAFLLDRKAIREKAVDMIDCFRVKTTGPDAPIASLSGGNVQRAILARELTGNVDFLVVSNPCFGLDIMAVSEIRSRIVAARNAGAAVLLLSEDLDEILELSDRIYTMSEGSLVYETAGPGADIAEIGRHMAGHH